MRLRNREKRRPRASIMLLAVTVALALAVFAGVGNGAIQTLAQGYATLTPYMLPGSGPGVGQTGALLYVGERNGAFDLYLAAPDGGGERQLTFGLEALYPAWSPDGSRIAFTGGVDNQDIYVMNADGSGLRNLTNSPSFERSPSWSPDGSQLVYALSSGDITTLYFASVDHGGAFPVDTGGIPSDWPSWSPDGRLIAFFASRDEGQGIYLLSLSPFSIQFVAASNLPYTAWSPDGKRIAYVAQSGGSDDIFVFDLERHRSRQLTFDASSDITPSWSPDGAHILFSSNRDGAYRLYSMSADGSDVQALGSAGPNYDPEWSPFAWYAVALVPTPTREKTPWPSNTPEPFVMQPTPTPFIFQPSPTLMFPTELPPTITPAPPSSTPRPTRPPATPVPVTPTTPPDALCVAVVPPGGDAPVRTSASRDGTQIVAAHAGQWMHVFEEQTVDGEAWYRVVFRMQGVRIFGWVLAEQVESLDAVAGPCPALEVATEAATVAPTEAIIPPSDTPSPTRTATPTMTPTRTPTFTPTVTATPT